MEAYCPPDHLQLNVPPAESPFWREYLERRNASASERALFEHYVHEGYVVVDLQIANFQEIAAEIRAAVAPLYTGGEHRVHDAWYHAPAVRALAAQPEVLRLLELFYGRRPIPFQTLNFDTGTEQPAHSDTLHFHSMPRHFMCGVWVALERIDKGCGPLVVFPGTHRLPDYDMLDFGLPADPAHYQSYEDLVRDMLREGGHAAHEVELEPGQAIIWAANLFHGGSPIREAGRTRHSQVTHYYFENCSYYFPMASDAYLGEVFLREVIDLSTGKLAPHRYRGQELGYGSARVLRYPRPLPKEVEVPVETRFQTLCSRLERRVQRFWRKVRAVR